jgi:hypothetical protein
MNGFRLFATLWNDDGGRCRILCDGRQHFVFERTRDGVLVERFDSSDPNRFHRYTYELCARGWKFAWAREEGDGDGNRGR